MTRAEGEPNLANVSISQESASSNDARLCLVAYFAELASRFEKGFNSDGALATAPNEFAPPHGAFFIARLGGKPVGCGGFVDLGAEVAEIKRVWTSPAARGLGVARRLLAALESEARARGFRHLRLDTNRSLAEAQAMYRKAGYREIDRYNDNPYAHHWFEKAI